METYATNPTSPPSPQDQVDFGAAGNTRGAAETAGRLGSWAPSAVRVLRWLWGPKTEGEPQDVVRAEFPAGTGARDMAIPVGGRSSQSPAPGRGPESSALRGASAVTCLPCIHSGTGTAPTWPRGAGGSEGTLIRNEGGPGSALQELDKNRDNVGEAGR